jgi:hypothetical protein
MVPTALFYGLVLLNLLFVTGAWCLARPSQGAAVVLIIVSGLWVLFNGPIEGHVLLSYTDQNGLTESDLLSLAGVIIALRALWLRRRW